MLVFTKSCQGSSCICDTVDLLLCLGIIEIITKSITKCIAWDFCNSTDSCIFSLLGRVEEQYVRSELGIDYLPNMALVSTNNMNTI